MAALPDLDFSQELMRLQIEAAKPQTPPSILGAVFACCVPRKQDVFEQCEQSVMHKIASWISTALYDIVLTGDFVESKQMLGVVDAYVYNSKAPNYWRVALVTTKDEFFIWCNIGPGVPLDLHIMRGDTKVPVTTCNVEPIIGEKLQHYLGPLHKLFQICR